MTQEFSRIADKYAEFSKVQKSASEILLTLLDIKNSENILDLACGSGHITKEIRRLTKGKVYGVDPSKKMIEEANKNSEAESISFKIMQAEEIDELEDKFDVIFCNSAFNWFSDHKKVIQNCYNLLKDNGRIGMQTPATDEYSPNFIKAINEVKSNFETKDIFKHFKSPWFFLQTADDYKEFFEKEDFNVIFSEIKILKKSYSLEDAYNIFESGASIGYLSDKYYDISITEEYKKKFRDIIKESFKEQTDKEDKIELVFNRVFLIAEKLK